MIRSRTFGLYQSGHFEGESGRATGEVVGKERKQLLDKDWWDGFVEFMENKTDTVRESGEDISYEQALNDYIENIRGFAANTKARQFLQAMVHAQVEVEYGAPLDQMSVSYAGYKLSDCFFCGANYYVPVEGGGFDKVLAPLVEPFKDKIRFNHVVNKIEYSDDQLARVTYTDASDGTKHVKTAQRVLVTVPLGVLKAKSIEFIPSLPQWKEDVIDYIGFGVLNKCILYWQDEEQASSWWPNGKEYLSLVTDQDDTSGLWTTFFNDKEIGNGGHFVLSAWIGGDDALRVEQQSDEAIVKQVLGNLRAMLGEEVPEPSKYVISRWGQDEFARGSYSFYNVGGRESVWKARYKLAKTVGKRLFWAGEASHEDYGTTYGAYYSGIDAAEKIRASGLYSPKSSVG
jgi:protoporphyrinogen oxidase